MSIVDLNVLLSLEKAEVVMLHCSHLHKNFRISRLCGYFAQLRAPGVGTPWHKRPHKLRTKLAVDLARDVNFNRKRIRMKDLEMPLDEMKWLNEIRSHACFHLFSLSSKRSIPLDFVEALTWGQRLEEWMVSKWPQNTPNFKSFETLAKP